MLDKRLWQEAKKDKYYLFGTIFCGLIVGFFCLGQAYFLAKIVNNVFRLGQDLNGVLSLLVFLTLIIIGRAAFTWLEDYFANSLAGRVQFSLRRQILAKIRDLGPVAIRGEQMGELINLSTEGVQLLRDYFCKYIPQLFKSVVIPLLLLIFAFAVNWQTGLILLITAPLVPFFMALIGSWTNKLNQKQWGLLSRLTGYLQDVMAGLATLKILNRSQGQEAKIKEVSENFRVTTLGVLRVAFLSALTLELLTTISIALVAVGLGLRLVNGEISFFYAFFLILLAPDFFLPLRTLGTYYHASLNGIQSANSIYQFLNKPVADAGELTYGLFGEIGLAVENLSCAYDGELVLKDLNFTISSGEKLAIIGESGSGKTTILNILAGFIRDYQGEVVVNGAYALSRLNRGAWLENLAVINQKPLLFAGTVRSNICFDQFENPENLENPENPDIIVDNKLATKKLDAKLQKMFADLGLEHWLASLPQGLDTPIFEGGVGISGGQQQLVALGRACLKGANLLLLDEMTDNLDLVTEEIITEGMAKLLANKTAVIAAHRLSTLKLVDKIMILVDGKIAAMGSHGQLLATSALYRQMIGVEQGGGVDV